MTDDSLAGHYSDRQVRRLGRKAFMTGLISGIVLTAACTAFIQVVAR